jgi:lipopolysaccharide transport system permease protein
MDFNSADTLVIDPPTVRSDSSPRPLLTIRPAKGWVPLDLGELWHFRDLMFALALRDVKLRYKQTALGVVWVVLQPLMQAGILSFVFGTIAHMKSGPIPYFVFSFAGVMAWNLYNNVLTKAGGSLVGNANLISKIFFPRLILPLSSLPSALLDFSIAVGVLGVIMAIYHIAPNWGLLLMPIWIFLLLLFAVGVGLVATSLMVSYRDVGYVLPVALQILFYACPIAYPASKVPAHLLFWYNFNPLAPIFEALNWSVFGTGTLDWRFLSYSAAAAAAVLMGGVFAFKHMEKKFADVI